MLSHAELYTEEFLQATQKTFIEHYDVPFEALKASGKHSPLSGFENNRVVNQLFVQKFGKGDGFINIEKIHDQCLPCHYYMIEDIKDYFNVEPVLTLGYVTFEGRDVFKFNAMDSDVVRYDEKRRTFVANIHAWLTLPSYEIIDFVFIHGYLYHNADDRQKEKLQHWPGDHYNALFGSADYVNKIANVIYHPVYIGTDVLVKHEILHPFGGIEKQI